MEKHGKTRVAKSGVSTKASFLTSHYQWLKFSAFDLDVLLEGELYLPRNNSLFHLDTSSSQQVGIPITKPFGAEQNLKLVPFFRHADLRTSIESQNEWDLGINLFFDWNTK